MSRRAGRSKAWKKDPDIFQALETFRAVFPPVVSLSNQALEIGREK
jgi:hypothetical protein